MTDRLVCNNVELDLDENVPVPINFSIADIKEPEKRKRNLSKSIKLPDTKKNRLFFQDTFSYHSTGGGFTFDATQKSSAQFFKKGANIIPDGVLKLNSVSIVDGQTTFDCNIYSESVDWFLLLANMNIADLGWQEYDHELSMANIEASWSTPSGSGYRYPLTERGNGRAGTTIWNTTDLVPYVHFKEVFEKIFKFLGVTFTASWLNTTIVKNIIIGFGGGDYIKQSLTPADINSRKIDITNGNLNWILSKVVSFPNPVGATGYNNGIIQNFGSYYLRDTNNTGNITFSGTVAQDTLAQYNATDVSFTIQRSGNYTIDMGGVINLDYFSGALTFLNASGVSFKMVKSGMFIYAKNRGGITSSSDGLDISGSFTSYFQSGDVIRFYIDLGSCKVQRPNPETKNPVTLKATSDQISLKLTSIDSAVTDGSTVTLAKFIPEMKCTDFLVSAIRQFQLSISEPNVYGVVKIEPSSDFYQATNVFDDITKLIDHSKEFKLRPSANEYGKYIQFKYKENKDFDNIKYFESYGNNYGDYLFQNSSYYAKGKQEFQLAWSNVVPYEISNGILVPRFISINGTTVKPNKGAPRIMMWNGLKPGSWTFRRTDDPSVFSTKTSYPCVHHFDDWQNPSFDLNFQLVNELYYVASSITTSNSYTEYYDEFLNEILNSNGKFLTCYVKWNANDVKNRDFSKLLMINGSLFRLNEISDFDDNFVDTTKIELIRVLNAKKKSTKKIVFPPIAIKDKGTLSSPVGTGKDTGVIIGGTKQVSRNSNLIRG